MVIELAKIFGIHTQFSCHLDMSMRKAKPLTCIDPYLVFFGYFLFGHTLQSFTKDVHLLKIESPSTGTGFLFHTRSILENGLSKSLKSSF